MSVDDISTAMNVSPTAIRQHLSILEGDSFIDKKTIKLGMGRPKYIYRLTEKAEILFPKEYSEMLTYIIEDTIGQKGFPELKGDLRRIGKGRAEYYRHLMQDLSPEDKINKFLSIFAELGSLVEAGEHGDNKTIKEYNCRLYDLAQRFGTIICEYHRSFIQDLLGAHLEILQCMAHGDPCCEFLVVYSIEKPMLK
jgi:predicted ArsR family transcriptional regulator